ncbi:hypothetical protein Q4S45_08430 [Massilia sp. R2A-15]|uniref:hypothetical protein n=1 Tax=Massilia sp. R2A-15 TaxID=3064278 RepID=UPI002735D301|nr:hypothetical protein [Massilia sp. R2A-15]WLI91132.1 hypothetical protein Q4S45_08430 [Massilia sp. R2A-15]
MITDQANERVIVVDRSCRIVWQYTLISDQFNQRVIEVDHARQIVLQQSALNMAGAGFNQLNGPCDGKKIGDLPGSRRRSIPRPTMRDERPMMPGHATVAAGRSEVR